MRILTLDCSSEFTGESLVGAFAGLGVSPSTFEWELSAIEIGDHHLHFDRQQTQGVYAVRFGVHGGALHVDHNHPDDHYDHDHAHEEHDHIAYTSLRTQIETAKVSDFIKSHSLGILRRIAAGQSELTGTPIDQIDFPENEALQWLVTTVLSCIGLDQFQVKQIFFQQTHPLQSPGHTHRTLSRAILSKLSARELLDASPIGAAILAEFEAEFGPPPKLKSVRTKYGLGPESARGHPSLLKATLGELE